MGRSGSRQRGLAACPRAIGLRRCFPFRWRERQEYIKGVPVVDEGEAKILPMCKGRRSADVRVYPQVSHLYRMAAQQFCDICEKG